MLCCTLTEIQWLDLFINIHICTDCMHVIFCYYHHVLLADVQLLHYYMLQLFKVVFFNSEGIKRKNTHGIQIKGRGESVWSNTIARTHNTGGGGGVYQFAPLRSRPLRNRQKRPILELCAVAYLIGNYSAFTQKRYTVHIKIGASRTFQCHSNTEIKDMVQLHWVLTPSPFLKTPPYSLLG